MTDEDRFYEAIAEGVARGIWRVATNATDMPTADFFDSVQKGVSVALKNMDFDSALALAKGETQ